MIANENMCNEVMNVLANSAGLDVVSKARALAFLAQKTSELADGPFINALHATISEGDLFDEMVRTLIRDISNEDLNGILGDVWAGMFVANPDGRGLPERLDLIRADIDVNTLSAKQGLAIAKFVDVVKAVQPDQFIALQKIFHSSSNGQIIRFVGNRLSWARETAMCGVKLIGTWLAVSVLLDFRRWWKGEITGTRLGANITNTLVSTGVGFATGFAGEMGGAAIGSCFGPVGTVAGAIVGGVTGAVVGQELAHRLISHLTCKFFNIPRSEALENAYKELGVTQGATNGEINSAFRKLALIRHPDKGGEVVKFHALQVSMETIRAARHEE